MNTRLRGTVFGIVSAVAYGTNPLGALLLYREGLDSCSALFYRFSLASVLLAAILCVQRESFCINRSELKVLALLSVMFAVSSLTYYTSFYYMDAGISSTLLFVYPLMVAVIMALFFKERVTPVTLFSILLALGGIGLLYKGEDGAVLSAWGVLLVMVSSLTYALYIVVINRSGVSLSPVKLTFYVMLFCAGVIALYSAFDPHSHLQPLTTPSMWAYAFLLAFLPTVVSLVFMTAAVHAIGSTPTAIMGALEPITAVLIGITVFGEIFTLRLGIGMLMILAAVILIIAAKSPAFVSFCERVRQGFFPGR